jgi:hypothetical protein
MRWRVKSYGDKLGMKKYFDSLLLQLGMIVALISGLYAANQWTRSISVPVQFEFDGKISGKRQFTFAIKAKESFAIDLLLDRGAPLTAEDRWATGCVFNFTEFPKAGVHFWPHLEISIQDAASGKIVFNKSQGPLPDKGYSDCSQIGSSIRPIRYGNAVFEAGSYRATVDVLSTTPELDRFQMSLSIAMGGKDRGQTSEGKWAFTASFLSVLIGWPLLLLLGVVFLFSLARRAIRALQP